jgi:predicted transcriptional regulator
MAKKRNKLEVIHDILTTINQRKEVKPTHILYKSNLSHKMMQEYIDELLEKKFITENEKEKSKTYSITKKGIDYLNEYQTMIKFMTSFGLND